MIDATVVDDNRMSALKRLTPDVLFPENEVRKRPWPEHYGEAWPLSEDYYLCVHDPEGTSTGILSARYGIYLLDSFGNRELIYRA